MPWKVSDVDSHKKGLTTEQKKKWVAIANAVLAECEKNNGSNCDAKAIRIANSKVTNNMNTYQNSVSEYSTRLETLNGRQYIVVPVTMMVEGVHNGSHGPLLHTAEELGKIPESWNGIPVTVGHPQVDGNAVPANSPEILENWAVGIVFNAEMNGSKLKAEAWLEVERLALHENLNARINNGEIIEVSVGVFSEDEMVEGSWNNEPYVAVARNLRPEHLALLPTQTGACSVADGCGIRTNSSNMIINESNQLAVLQELKTKGFTINELVVNSSLTDIVDKVRSKVYVMDSEQAYYYIEDIWDTYVIYRVNNRVDDTTKLYKQGYAITASGEVEFIGAAIEVVKKVEYETVPKTNTVRQRRITNNQKKEDTMSQECTACVKRKVDALIANAATSYTEEDRTWLETLEENQLDKMVPATPTEPAGKTETTVTPEIAVNALRGALKTEEDFINLMPTSMQEQTRSALKLHNDHKQDLVNSIMTNAGEGVWKKENLEAMPMETLEAIAKTAKVTATPPPANYAGLGAGTNLNNNNSVPTAPVLLPTGVSTK